MKKTFINRTVMVMAAAGGLMLTSCSDHDMFNPNYKSEEYAASWEKDFGKIDPNQDWSMATVVTANVDLGSTDAKVVALYTGMPGTSTSKKLGVLFANHGTITFDNLKGSNDVYVVAYNAEGKTVISDYFAVENGQVNISVNSANRANTRAVTRAAASLGNPISNLGVIWPGFEVWWPTDYCENGNKYSFNFDKIFELYNLNGVETSPASSCKASDIVGITGKGGVFEEIGGAGTWGEQCNLQKLKDLLPNNIEYVMESDGPMEISYMFGGTAWHGNKLGYLYYQDGASEMDILTAPRYILIDDATPQNNIKLDGASFDDGMKLPGIIQSYEERGVNPTMTGTKFKLTYFGEDGKGTGSDVFPAGTHIVFFGYMAQNAGEQILGSRIRYSLPWMNEKFYYTYTENHGGENKTETAINFVTYKWGDKVVLGMEDGTDHDMNDILFFVNGKFNDGDIPQMGEDPEPTPDPDPDPDPEFPEKTQSWILACEDLGSTGDYDFNDIVLEVTKEDYASESKLYARCLAAGGTLPANITYDNQEIGESHAMLGVESTKDMINTKGGITKQPVIVKTFTVDKNWTLKDNIGKFKIIITQDNGKDVDSYVVSAPDEGKAPQMIIVPGEWQWPSEYTDIRDAYPSFYNWNSDATLTDWMSVKVADNVINR